MHNGDIPNGMQIDHINHIRNDNRLENLRLVTNAENQMNNSIRSNSKTGIAGVTISKSKPFYIARITHNKKREYLGQFDNLEGAIKARKEAEIKYGFHENHYKFKPMYSKQ